VSDNPGGLERGVMINMVTVKGRITFEVNLAEVERHGLKMSSKLLRLAKRIIH
ncbi:MAG: YfiR family protein, partial [Gammaproteobacteria bacterium]|nr:YfiR family protein [Gammaproteobacteria bacterium]MBT3488449.1 YfiR family protein [Gammaproteobacteria bacterium]MBT4301789.1 YfiR family protein [Gammaproteobacteria bacterium]MBT4789025.1 YfiR family protein [Gammaproteobacteria bacterium]MBT5370884.1 YfiR family protein [Gammaproteobacteria bacterium]